METSLKGHDVSWFCSGIAWTRVEKLRKKREAARDERGNLVDNDETMDKKLLI